MFKSKSCPNCTEKIKKSFAFCPNCGFQLGSPKDYGLLGKEDKIENQMPKIMGGGIMNNMMNKMLGNAIKMLENEMAKEMGEMGKNPKTRVKLMINGKEINPSQKELPNENTKFLPIEFTKENLEKWKKLKKIEPKSNLKRMDDKIKYEIQVPEVSSIKDVSIIKLENSLEVRAIGEKTGYLKNISINLPLKKYTLLKGILTLELDAE